MATKNIESARPEVDRATLGYYQRLLGVVAAAHAAEVHYGQAFEMETPEGHIIASGSAVSDEHHTPGVSVYNSDTGEHIRFHLFEPGRYGPRSLDVSDMPEGVERDELGLAVQPGINGIYGDLEVTDRQHRLIHRAISTGSQTDWNLVEHRT